MAKKKVQAKIKTKPKAKIKEQRKLAAVMFTDMVGYSALTQKNEKLALELLEEHKRALRSVFPKYGGQEIKTIGDAFLVEFGSAVNAAQCAVEIQKKLHQRNESVKPERVVQIRIGLHVGDVVYKEKDVFGDGVNIASRIEPLAVPGGICVSEELVRFKIKSRSQSYDLEVASSKILKHLLQSIKSFYRGKRNDSPID